MEDVDIPTYLLAYTVYVYTHTYSRTHIHTHAHIHAYKHYTNNVYDMLPRILIFKYRSYTI